MMQWQLSAQVGKMNKHLLCRYAAAMLCSGFIREIRMMTMTMSKRQHENSGIPAEPVAA